MHYNSNIKNSDYYNAYKEEMKSITEYENDLSFQKILKIGFIILVIGLLSILSIYLVDYFSITKKEPTISQNIQKTLEKNSPKVIYSKDKLPKSIQLNPTNTQRVAKVEIRNENKTIEKTTKVNPKDVALIVETILAQMNHKEKIPLEKQLLSAQESKNNSKTLKESNHYNKIVISTSKSTKNRDEQIQLKKDLDLALVSNEKKISDGYEQAIKKEINVRSNEMRIIIVQKGDTLSKIAKKAYGDIDAYPKIFMANPEVLKNPDEIFVGQKLRIPA